MNINPYSNANISDSNEKNNQDLFENEKQTVLTDDEKYYFETQIFLSMLRGEISANCFRQPSLQELSILSYGVRKLFDQNNNSNNDFSNGSNSDLINSGSMSRILCFFSKYLDHRSPSDCAKIWKYVQGREEILPTQPDFEPTQLPEKSLINKYRKNSTVCVNKRKIAINQKKEILLGSLDSIYKKNVNISEVSLLVPYMNSFAAMTLDGKIYTIREDNEQIEYDIVLNAQKPLSNFRISQTITPIIAALSNDQQNIIYGQKSSYKEYKFTDNINQVQIDETNLCFSTKSTFYILKNDRISSSYEYSKNLNDFRILRNELVVLAYGDTIYELIDMRTPDKIFSSSFKTENKILDCQLSPLNNLFCFNQPSTCSIFDIRNPSTEIMSFETTKSQNISYKAKWIGDDRLIAVASDDGFYNLVDISNESATILKTYSLQPGNILDLNTTDDTVIITQPGFISIYQMNTRPILLPNFI